MSKIKIFSIVLSISLLVLSACDFEDINVDPARQSDAQLRDIFPGATTQTVFNFGASPARAAAIWMQQLAGFDAQQVDLQNYIANQSAFNNLWNFGLYAGAMKDCAIMLEKAQPDGEDVAPHYAGVAKILMAANLGLATTCWGDVPYTEAFQGSENLKPAFDTQEQIYGTINTLLTEAVADLAKEDNDFPLLNDLIYNGDLNGWIQTANALRARYNLHLVGRNGNAAAQAALDALANAYGSNADASFLTFGTAPVQANPYAQFGAQRPNTIIVLPEFADNMTNRADPRQDFFMDCGPDQCSFFTEQSNGLFWTSNDSPLPIISYTELKFIEAEALLRTGDQAGAATALNEAIVASMQQYGIDAATYQPYVDTYGNFTGLTNDDQRLERIITEKYYALYLQGAVEVWTDYRRTGFPALTPNPAGSNGLNPSGVIPRRFIYPTAELNTNQENVEAAQERQGGDLLDVNLWAY